MILKVVCFVVLLFGLALGFGAPWLAHKKVYGTWKITFQRKR